MGDVRCEGDGLDCRRTDVSGPFTPRDDLMMRMLTRVDDIAGIRHLSLDLLADGGPFRWNGGLGSADNHGDGRQQTCEASHLEVNEMKKEPTADE